MSVCDETERKKKKGMTGRVAVFILEGAPAYMGPKAGRQAAMRSQVSI